MITADLLTNGGTTNKTAGAYGHLGCEDGPGQPVPPQPVTPQELHRGYLAAGHAAPSPGQSAPPPEALHHAMAGRLQQVDLTGAHATVQWAAPIPGQDGR